MVDLSDFNWRDQLAWWCGIAVMFLFCGLLFVGVSGVMHGLDKAGIICMADMKEKMGPPAKVIHVKIID